MKRRTLLESSAVLTGIGGLLSLGTLADRSEEAPGPHAADSGASNPSCTTASRDFADGARPKRKRGERPLPYRESFDVPMPDHHTYGYTPDPGGAGGWVGAGGSITVEVDMGNMARKDQFGSLERDYYLLETDFAFRADLPVSVECCDRVIECQKTVTITDTTDTETETDTDTETDTPTPTPTPDPCLDDLDVWLYSPEESAEDCPDGCTGIEAFAESCDIASIGISGETCSGSSFAGEESFDCVDQGSFHPRGTCFEVDSTVTVTVGFCDREATKEAEIEVPEPGNSATPSSELGPTRQPIATAAAPNAASGNGGSETETEVQSYFQPAPLFVRSDPDDDSDPKDPDSFPPHLIYDKRVFDGCEVDRRTFSTPLPNPPFRLFSVHVNGMEVGRWDAEQVTFVSNSGGEVLMRDVKQKLWSLLTNIDSCSPWITLAQNYLDGFESVNLSVSYTPTHDADGGDSEFDTLADESLATVRVPIDVLNDGGHSSDPDGKVGPVDVRFDVHSDLFGAELNVHDVMVELAAPPVVSSHGWTRKWNPDNPRKAGETSVKWLKDNVAAAAKADVGQYPWTWARDEQVGRWTEPMRRLYEEGSEPHPFFLFPYDRKQDIHTSSGWIQDAMNGGPDGDGPALFGLPIEYEGKIWAQAHSMGGLVWRDYITNRDGDELVEKLAMDGTPNLGSPLGNKYTTMMGLDFRLAPKLGLPSNLGLPTDEDPRTVKTHLVSKLLDEEFSEGRQIRYYKKKNESVDPRDVYDHDLRNWDVLDVGSDAWWKDSVGAFDVHASSALFNWTGYGSWNGSGDIEESYPRDHRAEFQLKPLNNNPWFKQDLQPWSLTLDPRKYFIVWGDIPDSGMDPDGECVPGSRKERWFMEFVSDPKGAIRELFGDETVEEWDLDDLVARNVPTLHDGIVPRGSATVVGKLPNKSVPASHNFIPCHPDTAKYIWRFYAALAIEADEPKPVDHDAVREVRDHVGAATPKSVAGIGRGDSVGSGADGAVSGGNAGRFVAANAGSGAMIHTVRDAINTLGSSAVSTLPIGSEDHDGTDQSEDIEQREITTGVVGANDTEMPVTIRVPVGDGTNGLAFSVEPPESEDRLRAAVVDPDGNRYIPETSAEAFEYVEGRGPMGTEPKLFAIADGTPGEWTVELWSEGLPGVQEEPEGLLDDDEVFLPTIPVTTTVRTYGGGFGGNLGVGLAGEETPGATGTPVGTTGPGTVGDQRTDRRTSADERGGDERGGPVPDATPTGSGSTPTESGPAPTESTDGTGGSGPGFGIVGALGALGGAGALLKRYRNPDDE